MTAHRTSRRDFLKTAVAGASAAVLPLPAIAQGAGGRVVVVGGGFGGATCARFIRRIDADYRPHIAIMTAIYKHTRYQNEARLKYGIDDYLIKPVLPQSLAGLVRRVQAAA